MNILYINHYAGSIYHGMEFRPFYLAREWVRLGHTVTIIASNVSHLRTKNSIIPKGQNYLVEDIHGIQYIWCRTPEYSGNGIGRVRNIFSFLSRVKKLIPFFVKGSLKKITKGEKTQFNKPDLVIASSTYPFDTKIAYKIAKKAKAKFVYEIHDLWPLTPIELSGMSPKHPFIWLMQKAEDFGYKSADSVVSLLPKAKAYMCEHGMKPEKFVYIPNGISVHDVQTDSSDLPKEHQDQISKIKLEYQFVLGYAGGMGESNALNYLLDAAKLVPKFAIVLVGDGASKDALFKRISDEGISNVFFLPSVNKSQVQGFLKQMDALYIGWNNLPIYRFGICPNKLFDYMLSGKPIIHSVTAGNDPVFEAHCGISVAAGDVIAISKAITMIAKESAEDRAWLGKNGYEYVIKNNDYPVLAKRFLNECVVKP